MEFGFVICFDWMNTHGAVDIISRMHVIELNCPSYSYLNEVSRICESRISIIHKIGMFKQRYKNLQVRIFSVSMILSRPFICRYWINHSKLFIIQWRL